MYIIFKKLNFLNLSLNLIWIFQMDLLLAQRQTQRDQSMIEGTARRNLDNGQLSRLFR